MQRLINGECVDEMRKLDEKFDLVVADPPYGIDFAKPLVVGDIVRDKVTDWDTFTIDEYKEFTHNWITAARGLMKPSSSIWVFCSYHSIGAVVTELLDQGFYILNQIIWRKTNPTPQFSGTRFKTSFENIIWARYEKKTAATFNYKLLKKKNKGKQMADVWESTVLSTRSSERLTLDGKAIHLAQKPLWLLKLIIEATTEEGDVILDPFSGVGSTCVAAKALDRGCVGIEIDEGYHRYAVDRLTNYRTKFTSGKTEQLIFELGG